MADIYVQDALLWPGLSRDRGDIFIQLHDLCIYAPLLVCYFSEQFRVASKPLLSVQVSQSSCLVRESQLQGPTV